VEGFSYNYYEDLTPEDVVGIVDTLKKGGKPKVGGKGGACDGAWELPAFCVTPLRWPHSPDCPALPTSNAPLACCLPSCPPALPVPQVGSQHRLKAEPAGAVVNGKWVASKPTAEQTTLTGVWLGRRGGRAGRQAGGWVGRRHVAGECKGGALEHFTEGTSRPCLLLLNHACQPMHLLPAALCVTCHAVPCLAVQASPLAPTAATWMRSRRSRQLPPSKSPPTS